jgi:hypothetical protein
MTDKQEILDSLWDKHEALYRYRRDLNNRLTPGERIDHAGDLDNAKLEMDLVWATRQEIKDDGSLAFPSDEEVRALQDATGRLQAITEKNTAYNALIGAATKLIQTWPVSGGEPQE